ncbi:hypothetical protein J5N97_021503 [Dioscorea zingiberensis]|uniref:Uncharacterized protein n=1 Tax=Dioscorea zingiberensis TaxID=325984 RepID=A0A9D5CIK0_9LILI|nr:hypothetical protein J5N97_021503 [Dioscorea zingiberensis]
MVPARNLLRRHYDSYGSCFSDQLHQPKTSMKLAPPLIMAEDEDTRIGGDEEEEEEEDEEGEGPAGTSTSKDSTTGDHDHDHDDWLQLGIGSQGNQIISNETPPSPMKAAAAGKMPGGETRRLMELPLFSDSPIGGGSRRPVAAPVIGTVVSGGADAAAAAATVMPSSLFPSAGVQVRPWGLWSPNHPMLASTSAVSSHHQYYLPQLQPRQYDYRQFVYPNSWSLGSPAMAIGEGSSAAASGLRIVSPPRRPQAGVWFCPRGGENQGREPFLPQIPKSYLRIKDGRMTVRLLMKYLVNKLGLEDESQVEITCRGQQLLPLWTLQHVRDNVWFSGEAVTALLLPESPAADQVMALQYGRRA